MSGTTLKLVFTALAALSCWAAPAADAPEGAAAFLGALRANASGRSSTYAILSGKLEHQRNDLDPEEFPLFFAVCIAPERTVCQVIADDREGYFVGQTGSTGNRAFTEVVPMRAIAPGASLLARAGVSPTDLSLGFLHYELVKELPEEKVGVVGCRVLLLKDPVSGTRVRVYASKKYLFALKAEFLDGDSERVKRTVEISAFQKSNELYYVKKLVFSGPGWITRIVFDRADVGAVKLSERKEYFRKLPKEAKP